MSDDAPGPAAPHTEGPSRRDLSADQQFWQQCRQGRRPELGPFLAARPGLPSAEVAAVIAIDQYERWQAGQRVPAEDYLALLPADADAGAAACDVIYGEVLVREQLGEAPALEDYCRRFPAHAAALTRQVELHRALADEPSPPTVLGQRVIEPVEAGPQVPGYEVLEELGHGGMGVVYKARQLSLDREVALKVVWPRGGSAAEALQRAVREAQVLARLSHPNIVTVYDAGTAGGAFFVAMELVAGTDLHRLVDRQGPLGVPLACELLRQAARGLHHAHERGLVHRDVKPSNLLVARPSASGPATLKILDLGLARLVTAQEPDGAAPATQVGAFLGTPDFIAPEQANDPRAADARSDLYSLGCTFFFALTGRTPFPGATPLATLMQHHLTDAPVLAEYRPDAPPALGAVLTRLLAKRPEDRYATAAELADAVEALLRQGDAAPAAGLGPAPPLSAQVGRKLSLRPGPRLVGHTDWVKGVAFTADGRHVASAGLDRTVRLWDIASGREAWRGEGHTGGVLAVAARPTGPGLLSGGEDRAVVLWSPVATAPVWRGEGHGHNVNVVAFTPDGQQAISGSHDGTLRVWAADGGQALRAWAAHAGAVWSIAVLPGGQRVLSAGQDRMVRIWDVRTGELVGALPEQPAPALCIAVTPDGRDVLVGGGDGLVRLWDLQSQSDAGTLDGHGAGVTALAVSPDGRHAVSGSRDQSVRVWALASRQGEALTGHSHWVTSVAWSGDGTRVCSGSGDRTVCLWQVEG